MSSKKDRKDKDKGQDERLDKRQFYSSPMVLQIRLYNAPYDEIIHTQKKPNIRDLGGMKYIYVIDDFGNTHDFRADSVLSIHSWKKSHYLTMMRRMEDADAKSGNTPPKETAPTVIEVKPVEEIKTPAGEKVVIPNFKAYTDVEEDGIWPSK